jgi:hypothetical protein
MKTLEECKREAEQALERAAEKLFGPPENRDATEKLQFGGAQEEVKEVAANTSARSLPEIDAAATTQGGCRHGAL